MSTEETMSTEGNSEQQQQTMDTGDNESTAEVSD
jgi:hypothetical protein